MWCLPVVGPHSVFNPKPWAWKKPLVTQQLQEFRLLGQQFTTVIELHSQATKLRWPAQQFQAVILLLREAEVDTLCWGWWVENLSTRCHYQSEIWHLGQDLSFADLQDVSNRVTVDTVNPLKSQQDNMGLLLRSFLLDSNYIILQSAGKFASSSNIYIHICIHEYIHICIWNLYYN